MVLYFFCSFPAWHMGWVGLLVLLALQTMERLNHMKHNQALAIPRALRVQVLCQIFGGFLQLRPLDCINPCVALGRSKGEEQLNVFGAKNIQVNTRHLHDQLQ